MPASQIAQDADDASDEDVPAGQRVQDGSPLEENLPALQGLHESVDHAEPAKHSLSQLAWPVLALYFGAAQSVQDDAPADEYLPEAQVTQSSSVLAPGALPYLPAGQSVQDKPE